MHTLTTLTAGDDQQELIYELGDGPDVRLRVRVHAHGLGFGIPIQPLRELRVPFIQFFLDPVFRGVVRLESSGLEPGFEKSTTVPDPPLAFESSPYRLVP